MTLLFNHYGLEKKLKRFLKHEDDFIFHLTAKVRK